MGDAEEDAKRAFLARIDAKLAAAGHPVAPAPAQPPPPAMPPVLSAPAHLRGTDEAPDLPAAMIAAMGRLPFVPPAPVAPEKRSAKTITSKAAPSRAGGKTMSLDHAVQRPTPNLPFAGTSGDAGAVYVPPLDARQYVALRAELALQVAARQETLKRYQVPNEAALRALEEQWKHPARRAELGAALGEFAAMLRGEVLR